MLASQVGAEVNGLVESEPAEMTPDACTVVAETVPPALTSLTAQALVPAMILALELAKPLAPVPAYEPAPRPSCARCC